MKDRITLIITKYIKKYECLYQKVIDIEVLYLEKGVEISQQDLLRRLFLQKLYPKIQRRFRDDKPKFPFPVPGLQ